MGLLSGVLSIAKGVGGIIDKLHTSDEEKMELKIRFQELLNSVNAAQALINLQDAKSRRSFQANWRPFIGWTCGIGLAFNIFSPLIQVVVPEMPNPDNTIIMSTLMGMLGLGGMRTYEKLKGAAK